MNTIVANTPTVLESPATPSLKDLLQNGIYLLFMLKNGNPPATFVEFSRRVDTFLAAFEKNGRNFGKSPEAIHDSKYAFCALMDEIILSSIFPLREEWERAPLQLRLFGEHLAGEGFFDRLEGLRLNPEKNVEVLEVYYTCLLLGFQGKYLLEGAEKLNDLVARLGQEIAHARGGAAEFAPHWKLPLKFNEYVRHELPLWLYFALLALIAVAILFAFRGVLGSQIEDLLKSQAAAVERAQAKAPGTRAAARNYSAR